MLHWSGCLRCPRQLGVDVSYVAEGEDRIRFAVGSFDATQALVIDPVLSYSTYLGGANSYNFV